MPLGNPRAFYLSKKIKTMAGKNLFNSVQYSRPNSNVFDLSHDVKLSCNMGQLVPICCLDVVPGDRFKIGCESMIRFAPMVVPPMHRVDVYMHYFFTPKRILWESFEDFITNTPDDLGNLPAWPFVDVSDANYGKLADYFGIPTPITGQTERISVLPFVAYQMIRDEYYRDQNLMESTKQLNGGLYCVDGDNTVDFATRIGKLHNRCWEHDYFTAALPFAQKGAAVSMPLGNVQLNPDWHADAGAGDHLKDYPHWVDPTNANVITGDVQAFGTAGTNAYITTSTVTPIDVAYDPGLSLVAGAGTINDLRRAFRLQEWLEKAARGGSRYSELIRSMFGVISSDARLQRPEYITGIKSPVQISEVLNTTGTSESPQGAMAGHGIAHVQGRYGGFRAEEHGYIIGIMSIMPKTAYQQGIPKHFLKINDPFEHYWEQFANIGEQEVLNKEIYAFQGATGAETFGYIPRYSEYKFESNRVAGDFRNTLNHWHMGRIFATPPALNSQFVESDPTNRIFAVVDETDDKMWCHVYNKIRAVRLMPKYGTPTF